MSDTQLAATLYTLRDFIQTPAGIAQTLRKVKEIGYASVQLSALGPIDPEALAAMLKEEGLGVCVTHTSYERLQDDLDAVLEEHRLWGCRHVALGSMPPSYRTGEDGFHAFARDVSPLARAIREAGMTLSYHNHHWELERYSGRTGLDILMDESDPAFGFEIDTYWIQYGGGDPAAWIRKAAGRAPVIHFKDMGVSNREQVMAEVGEGNLNWPAILDACRHARSQWYVVEQDRCAGDPFDSLAISLRNMKAMGLA